MKKFISVFLSITMLASTFSLFAMSTEAATYRQQLLDKGFTYSYVDKLEALHEKYPSWVFEPFVTDLNFDEAVKGELKNTPTTEANLRSYLDPRNWLDETYIFQFESIKKEDSTQTKNGVEGILSGTWMSKSLIKYKTTGGNDKTYNSTTKYSDAMLTASKNSGLSAYYIATKIKQENGGKTASATAVCGTKAPFQGIYNYYNIGAYANGSDGLAWAAGFLMTNKQTKLYSSFDTTKGEGAGDVTVLKQGQRMTWRKTQDSNYYYVRLYNGESRTYTEGKSGYVLIDDVRTTYLNNGRPWTNPYKSINYGAQYIANGYLKYQYTIYLQKFNVNKASGSLYAHEYMANVSGATSEAYHLYNGYKKADLLNGKRIFYIPIFKNIEKDKNGCPYIYNLKQTARTTTSATIQWDAQDGADGYYVYKYTPSTKIYKLLKTITNPDTTKVKLTGLTSGTKYNFVVSAYIKKDDKIIQGKKCEPLIAYTTPATVTGLKLTALADHKIKVSWEQATGTASGYEILWARDSSFKDVITTTVITNKSTLTYTGKNFTKGRRYYIKVRAYSTIDNVKRYGAWCSYKSVVSK